MPKKKKKEEKTPKKLEGASGFVELMAPEARRRVWRVVGVEVGLPRHDVEVEVVVLEDDAVLIVDVRGRAR